MKEHATPGRRGERFLEWLREEVLRLATAGIFCIVFGFAPEDWIIHLFRSIGLSPPTVAHLMVHWNVRTIAAVLGLVMIAGDVSWRWWVQRPSIVPDLVAVGLQPNSSMSIVERVTAAATARNVETAASDGRPSIAVMPFMNLSEDREQEHFSNGLSEDITAELSRRRWLFVISPSSTFAYKDRDFTPQKIGDELKVKYLIAGSVRRAGEHIKVTARLLETGKGGTIWSDNYDSRLVDVFAVQEEITLAVVAKLDLIIAEQVSKASARKPPARLDAWEAYQRGLLHYRRMTVDDDEQARRLFQHAIALEPDFSPFHQALVYTYVDDATLFFTRSVAEAVRLMEPHAITAVDLDTDDAGAHAALGMVWVGKGDLEAALAQANVALNLSSNSAESYRLRSICLVFSGHFEEGIQCLDACLRLNPCDPRRGWTLSMKSIAQYQLRDYEASVATCHEALQITPNVRAIYRWQVAGLGQLGDTAEAQKVIAKASAAFAPITFDEYAAMRWPWAREGDYQHMLEGLRKAGWHDPRQEPGG